MGLGMLRQLLLFIPLVILLPIAYGIDGAWFAGPVADTLAFLVTIILLIVEIRKLSNIGQTKVQHRNYSRAYSQNA